MRLRAAVCATIATLVADTPPAGAHALTGVLVAREAQQKRTLWRDHGTIRFFARRPWLARTTTGRRALRFARAEIRWTTRELRETQAALGHLNLRNRTLSVGYWAAKQIAAATVIGRESTGDPWPHCPDPFDGGGSWYATVACENAGSWYDSPGYFRCGLQFDPMWERRFGRLCP